MFLIVHPKIHILYKASPAAFKGMSNDILRSELQLVDSTIHTFCVRPLVSCDALDYNINCANPYKQIG